MLSFEILHEENIDSLKEKVASATAGCDAEYLCEILESLLDDEAEIGISHSDGCLLVRIFDEGYSFVYPIPISDEADDIAALDAIRLYVIKEEIPFRLTDLPSEALDEVSERYLHVSVDYYDPDREAYEVSILNAAAREDIPTLDFDGLTLDALNPRDDGDFAMLSKDEETNRFWGYDYRADNPNPSDDYFRLESLSEFDRGVTMSFAIRQGDVFLGEATLYAFDYLGGCELAIRILPTHRRLGIAGRVIDGFKSQGRSLGLLNIRATVLADNLRSVAMCKKHFEEYTLEGEIYKFINHT